MASATKDACCLVCVQRMLAHRVGQHYGLQTSTVDYEECNGRVIGVRTKYTMAPKVGNWRKHQLWPRFCGAWEALLFKLACLWLAYNLCIDSSASKQGLDEQ